MVISTADFLTSLKRRKSNLDTNLHIITRFITSLCCLLPPHDKMPSAATVLWFYKMWSGPNFKCNYHTQNDLFIIKQASFKIPSILYLAFKLY